MHFFLNKPFVSLILVNLWRVLNHSWSTEIPFRISLTSEMLMFNMDVLGQWLEHLIWNSKGHEFYSHLRRGGGGDFSEFASDLFLLPN